MTSLERAIVNLTKAVNTLTECMPHLIREQTQTETVKRLKRDESERFERMRDFPRVELTQEEEERVHGI